MSPNETYYLEPTMKIVKNGNYWVFVLIIRNYLYS